MSKEGIEIHFDKKRGSLELACAPDEFAPYREIARDQLKDFPGIPLEEVIEMNIVDTGRFVSGRDAPRRRIGGILFSLFIVGVLILAVVGAYAIIVKIVS